MARPADCRIRSGKRQKPRLLRGIGRLGKKRKEGTDDPQRLSADRYLDGDQERGSAEESAVVHRTHR